MSIPVIFTQVTANMPVTTAAQLASTAGSIITILNIALIDGANQLNIVSITRTGDVAVVETDVAHPYVIGETVHIDGTPEAYFNAKFKILQLLTPTTFSIRVQDIGELTTGAIGTVKHAAAGWTKTDVAANVVAYHSAPYPDGSVRTVQIEDNSPFSNTYDFRVRLAVGWTALNTATKISSARRWTKNNGNLRWGIVADDKTLQVFFSGMNNYYVGHATGIDENDNNISMISTGLDGGTYGYQFGAQSIMPVTQTIAQTGVAFLESPFSVTNDNFASISINGCPSIGALSLASMQSSCRFANPISGKMMTAPIDIWEKLADAGQTHYPRARAKGITQPLGRLPFSVYADIPACWLPIRETAIDGTVKDFAVFQTTSTTQTSCAHLSLDLNMW